MAGRRVQYQIVGRYMNGTSVTGYQVQSSDGGKTAKLTREQVALLVGRGQVVNCGATIYRDKLIFKGIGVNLDSLPMMRDTSVQAAKNQADSADMTNAARESVQSFPVISAVIVNGRNTVGYVLKNAKGEEKKVSRKDCLILARDKKIGNVRLQMYNEKPILRGAAGTNLNELPVINIANENENGGQITGRNADFDTTKIDRLLANVKEGVEKGRFERYRVYLDKSDYRVRKDKDSGTYVDIVLIARVDRKSLKIPDYTSKFMISIKCGNNKELQGKLPVLVKYTKDKHIASLSYGDTRMDFSDEIKDVEDEELKAYNVLSDLIYYNICKDADYKATKS